MQKGHRRLALNFRGLIAILVVGLLPVSARAGVFYPETATLANGMQVVVVPNTLSDAVVQMVWYKAGASDDPVGRSGTAHYLEHLMFKGTKNMPAGTFSSTVAALGGQDNAFTTQDYTAYHVTVAREHLSLVMQMEADRMQNLHLDPKDAATELDVVRSERQERTDNNPQGKFDEQLRAVLFPSHVYGRPVIGWQQDLARLSVKDAVSFYRTYYRPDNATLVLSGNITLSDALVLAAGTFGRVGGAAGVRKLSLPVPREEIGAAKVVMHDPRVRQPVWTRRIEAPVSPKNREDALALEILAETLAGGEVGLLHRHFVVDSREAAGVDISYDSAARGPGQFVLVATPSPRVDAASLGQHVDAYLRILARQGLPKHVIEEAKRRLQDAAVFARDRLMAPAQILGEALAVGQRLDDVERWPERIKAVNPARVNAALRQLVTSKQTVVGLLLPEQAEGSAP